MKSRSLLLVLLPVVGAVALAGGATTASAQTAMPQPYAPPPPNYYASPPPYWSMQQRMDYEEGQPVPPGYHVSSHPRRGLIVGGAVTFGVLYGLSVLIADSESNDDGVYRDNSYKWLYVPCIGPFVYATKSSGAEGTLIIDGVAQTAGLFMFIAAFAWPKTELVRNDVATLHVMPMLGRDRSGLSLVGQF